jgi:hypothetical protein
MRFTTSSACIAALCLMIGGASAQTPQGQKVSPGNEPTKAVGSQVEPMKGDCPDKTVNADQQHAPTAATGTQVPQMTAQSDCPDGKTPEKK